MSDNTVKAPMPGTFYRRPSPDEDPYVEEGDSIEEGDVVGLIEVMKDFNEITCETGGTVKRVLVEDEEAVNAGQDLIEIE